MAAIMSEASPSCASTSTFEHWWRSTGVWVEPANLRRGGESGVQLLQPRDAALPALYCKRQVDHTYRSLWHPFGRPTIAREQQAYQALARLGIKTPTLVYCAVRRQQGRWQALLVTEALQGFVSLQQWYAQAPAGELREAVLRQIGVTLARLHRARWQHGCCYPKHIFVRAQVAEDGTPAVEIALLDLEKSRRRLRAQDAARHDLRQLARHHGNMPAADLLLLQQAYRQTCNQGDT